MHDFFSFFGQLIESIMSKLYPMTSTDHLDEIPAPPFVPASPPEALVRPIEPSSVPKQATQPVSVETPNKALFDTPKHAFHSVRVICDNEGLSVDEKNLICACIYQESMFYNTAKNQNKNAQSKVLSTDYGICQVNDYYHIGVKKDFPSVQYVLDNPDKVVEWMIHMYKWGLLKQWVSFSSGAYKKWLLPISPMWLLK